MAAKKRRKRADADEGVRRCMELMADGRWVSGKSHADVAFEFGVSPATVKDWATSASRVLRLAIEPDREAMRARIFATLETVISTAMQTVKTVTKRTRSGVVYTEQMPAPSLQAASSALETQAKLYGLITQHVAVTTRPSVGHLTREEHAAELAKLAEEIAAEQKRLLEESH